MYTDLHNVFYALFWKLSCYTVISTDPKDSSSETDDSEHHSSHVSAATVRLTVLVAAALWEFSVMQQLTSLC